MPPLISPSSDGIATARWLEKAACGYIFKLVRSLGCSSTLCAVKALEYARSWIDEVSSLRMERLVVKYVIVASAPDRTRAPAVKARVTRAFSPRAERRRLEWALVMSPNASPISKLGNELVAEAAYGKNVSGIGRVVFHLGSKASNVHIDKATIAEIVITPDPFEEMLSRHYLAGIGS